MIDFQGGHTTVIGLTRSGKTYATKKSLEKAGKAVLFFNTQHEDMPKSFVVADGDNHYEQLNRALKQMKKINFLPDTDTTIAQKQLAYLINKLYDGSKHDMILVVDEIHLFEKEALKNCIRVATTGLRFGITGVWISQRPANINNTLMTQSNQFVIFETNMESNYFKQYGIPHEDIRQRLEQGGKYSYCTYNFKDVKGPDKV